MVEEFLQRREQQGNALLLGQAANHAVDGQVCHGQPRLLLQALFADLFASHVVDAVGRRQEFVELRIPVLVVAAVEDAAEIRRPLLEDMRHAVGAEVSQQLLGIVGADRIDLVCVKHPALEQIDMTVVVVDAAFVVGDLGHGPELLAAKHPLKRRVVNADHAAGLLEEGVVGVTGFQQQRQQAGVPVIAVGDIRGKAKLLAGMEGSGREEGKALAIIRIGLIVFGVELGAIEILRAVEQIDADAIQLHLVDAITDIRQPRVGWQPA